MTLATLLEIDAQDRIDAIDHLHPEEPGAAYAVRDVLLGDEDASVRAAAAAFFERARRALDAEARDAATRALADALYDTHPSVRMAACRALAKLAANDALPLLRRLALEEPIWWVRRAAVLAVARIDRHAAVPVLRRALDDPFWRVRHAAVRALLVLGEKDDARIAALASETSASERAEAALRFIERRLGSNPGAARAPAPAQPSQPLGKIGDPDPAVVAARLDQGRQATAAELALYLGDPHEALRRAASVRLREAGDVRALLAAGLWLEEPRIPHATATVVALFDSLDGADFDALVDAALDAPDARPGLAAWAISSLAATRRGGRRTLAAMEAATPLVRRAATAALGDLAGSREGGGAAAGDRTAALARLRAALSDPDEDVRRLAVHGLVRAGDRAVLALAFEEQPALVRRLLARAAHEAGDLDTSRIAARDVDPETRSRGLAALHVAGLLDPEETHAARRSPDPWVRAAVLEPHGALDVLRGDVDPLLKRAAFDCAAQAGLGLEAARAACADEDAWLRTRAAERLARSDQDEDLARVLSLARDPSLAVRAAAAAATTRGAKGPRAVLAGAGDVSSELREQLLRLRSDERLREAADTWLGTRAVQLIDEALRRPRVDASRDAAPATSAPACAIASPRRLGRSGIVVSPLVVSGAWEPSVASLFRATDEGVNAFFWEPRYRSLTTFLRAAGPRGRDPLVIAGTYHATARAIRADVERALRRLRRDRLDVFLVFWTRSAARLEGEVPRALERLVRDGLVRAVGFSTHDRALAEQAITAESHPWDVVMVRHSAAHPGAEASLFRRAEARDVGVLAFSATSYGRLLVRSGADVAPPTAAECYRYSLSQGGVGACVSAPRGGRELVENLDVLRRPTLDEARMAELREHGRRVREVSLDFAAHIRRFPALPDGLGAGAIDAALDVLDDDRAEVDVAMEPS